MHITHPGTIVLSVIQECFKRVSWNGVTPVGLVEYRTDLTNFTSQIRYINNILCS
jgi:hypothetical protein